MASAQAVGRQPVPRWTLTLARRSSARCLTHAATTHSGAYAKGWTRRRSSAAVTACLRSSASSRPFLTLRIGERRMRVCEQLGFAFVVLRQQRGARERGAPGDERGLWPPVLMVRVWRVMAVSVFLARGKGCRGMGRRRVQRAAAPCAARKVMPGTWQSCRCGVVSTAACRVSCSDLGPGAALGGGETPLLASNDTSVSTFTGSWR